MKLFNLFRRKQKAVIILNEKDVLNILNKEIGKKFDINKFNEKLSSIFNSEIYLCYDSIYLDAEEVENNVDCYTSAYDDGNMLIDFFIFVSENGNVLYNETKRHY